MREIKEPIKVNLVYIPQTPKYDTFKPIKVDLGYPTNQRRIDEKLSVLKRVERNLTEWAENRNVSILYSPKSKRKLNHNCGIMPNMTTTFWERLNQKFNG